MECLTALCLYASVAIGAHGFDYVGPVLVVDGKAYYSPTEHLANVTLGAQHGSFFIEVDHTSDPTTSEDRGWEELRIGYRKQWSFRF